MRCIKSSTETHLRSNTAACLFVHQMRLIVAKNHSIIFIVSVLHSFKKAKWLCQINSILTQISLLIMVFSWKEKITVGIEILNSVVLVEFFLVPCPLLGHFPMEFNNFLRIIFKLCELHIAIFQKHDILPSQIFITLGEKINLRQFC